MMICYSLLIRPTSGLVWSLRGPKSGLVWYLRGNACFMHKILCLPFIKMDEDDALDALLEFFDNETDVVQETELQPVSVNTGTKFEIGEDFEEFVSICRSEGMTWEEVANHFGCSVRWLYTWKNRIDFVDVKCNVQNYPGSLIDELYNGTFEQADLPTEMEKLLDHYRELALSWEDIAFSESICIRWLKYWRKIYNYQDLFVNIDDEDLDRVVADIVRDR